MAGSDRWYFDKHVLATTPSRRCGIDADKELSYRQQAANLIQDMGQRLHVSQLCINTAIVYMHRFYTFHSFTKFHRNSISSCALFLAAKVEEQPRKLEHVIKVSHMCLHRDVPAIDAKSEAYKDQAMELVFNENLMLQTLGFDIAVEHPHTAVVNCCQMVRASKDLAQTSYFMATNSLHLTTMCLQYKPTVVACVCIHLACKWSRWEIPRSSEGKDWFHYVDPSVSLDLLEQLTSEFLAILDKCPSRLKRKVITGGGGGSSATISSSHNRSADEKRSSMTVKEESKSMSASKSSTHHERTDKPSSLSVNPDRSRRSPATSPLTKKVKTESQPPSHQPTPNVSKPPVSMSFAAYRERKEKANTQQQQQPHQLLPTHDCPKPAPSPANKSLTHSVPNRDIHINPQKERISPKQRLISDKQRQSDERHKVKHKNSDSYLFEGSSRASIAPKPSSLPSNQKSLQNNITEDFYDTLLNKPSSFNSIFSADGDDSMSEFKKDVGASLQMEFSDNSNQSNDGLNLTSFPSDFMNDSSDSKKSFNNNNNINNNNNKSQTNLDTKPTSFMSIFSTPIATSTTVHTKSDITKTSIPSKYSDVLSRIKPEPLPPMLSPLKSMADIEPIPKLEKPFASHSSAQPHLKINSIMNSEIDPKLHQNLKLPKNSPKLAKPSTHLQKGFVANVVPTFKDKEYDNSLQNVKSEPMEPTIRPSVANLSHTQNIMSINDMNNICEPLATILPKLEIQRELSSKAVEVPSVLSKTRPQLSGNIDIDMKPNVNILGDPKSTLNLSPIQQMSVNNTSVASDMAVTKPPVMPIVKESKDKSSHSEERHHKHSHKNSKHKDKHKHKHKDKDRERSKRKDKHRDRDRDRDRERDRTGDDFKVSSHIDADNDSPAAPLKLKISKKKLSVDEMDNNSCLENNNNETVPLNPLKLRIQLKDQKLTANASEFHSEYESNSGRKRKSSPKSSKKEKISKHENDDKVKDKSSKSRKSSDGNKSSNHMISYEMNSSRVSAQQLFNTDLCQTLAPPALQSRSQKTHK